MAIYKETFEEAKRTIAENWFSNGSKPNLFAHVQIKFGKKYMIDYTETYIRPGIQVIEDLMHNVDDICAGVESEDNENEDTERDNDMEKCRHCGKDVTIMSMDIEILGGPTFKGPLCKDCSEYVQRNHRLPEMGGRKWWQFWK